MNFGDRLLELRKKKNMSQETLANEIGVTRQTVSNWEMNITTPNVVDLKKIANALKINYDELLYEHEIEKENKFNKNNNINDEAKVILKILKTFGVILMLGIIVALIFLIISKVNYDKMNVIGGDSIRCIYKESIYTYNIDYNKKHKIVNVEITGQVSENDTNIEWINELGIFATSKEITEPNILITYISQKYEEYNGHCS